MSQATQPAGAQPSGRQPSAAPPAARRPAAVPTAVGTARWPGRLLAALDGVDTATLPPVGRAAARARDAADDSRWALRDAATRTSQRLRRAAASHGRWERGARLTVTVVVVVVAAGALASFGHSWVTDRPHSQLDPPPAVADGAATILPASIPSASAVPGSSDPGTGPIAFVGRPRGESVPGYVAAAGRRLAALAWADGDTPAYAAVSLPGYRTPAELTRLLAGYQVVEVYFRVPPYGTAMAVAVHDPAADLPSAFDRAAVVADQRAVIGPSSSAVASRAADQARALRARCSCVYGAVVRAPATRLASLSAAEGIRLVDPAPAARVIPGRTRFAALVPEQQ